MLQPILTPGIYARSEATISSVLAAAEKLFLARNYAQVSIRDIAPQAVVAAGVLGVGQACLDASVDFARNRRKFGQRIGDFEMIQSDIVAIVADVEAARMLVYRAA